MADLSVFNSDIFGTGFKTSAFKKSPISKNTGGTRYPDLKKLENIQFNIGEKFPAAEEKPKPRSFLDKAQTFLAGAAEAPVYTTGSKREILKNLPNEIVRKLLPNAAALNDNPELAAQITNKDIAKEVPKLLFENFVAPVASFALTFYGASNTVLNKAGFNTVGNKEGEVSFNIPGLGKVTNMQARIAERFANQPVPSSKLGIAANVTGYTGIELLNGLYAASLLGHVVNPRLKSIANLTSEQSAQLGQTNTLGTGVPEAAKVRSFGLYQQPTITTPQFTKLNPEFVKKLTDIGVDMSKYNSANPTFFRFQLQPNGQITGKIISVKPSFLQEFLNVFKGDITKVPASGLDTLYSKDINAKQLEAPKVGSFEQITEQNAGWKPGMRQAFDTALLHKDRDTILKLLPDVPESYKITLADKIKSIVGNQSALTPAVTGVPSVIPPANIAFPRIPTIPPAPAAPSVVPPVPETPVNLTALDNVFNQPKVSGAGNAALPAVTPPIGQQVTNGSLGTAKGAQPVQESKSFITPENPQETLKVLKADLLVAKETNNNLMIAKLTNQIKQLETVVSGLIIKPTEAKTPVQISQEKTVVIPEQRGKTLVDRVDIAKIVNNTPEFKNNPVLTVNTEKELVFVGEKQSFRIKAEALGLNSDNLTVGDKIRVDIKSLKAKGAPKQLRVYKGGEVQASIGKYRDGTPITLKEKEGVKRIELPEMVQLAKELMGKTPKIRTKASRVFGGQAAGVFKPKEGGEITLRADLFDPEKNSLDQVVKTLAHEIGHLIDYLPDETLKRGNLMGRLNTLRGFMKDFYAPAGASRSNPELKAQLWELSKYWKPIDEATASPGYLAYRKSSKELYADFISVLFNDPALAQQKAPTAYNIFFDQLDKKPAVKDAYFDLQASLHGERESIIKARREGVQKMFNEGDMKSVEYQKVLQDERKARAENSLYALKFNLVDNNTPMIERVKKLEKAGTQINMDEDPRYMLEERNYIGGQIKAELEKNVVPVFDDLKKHNISWDTFGEALFYDRIIAGDRSKQANPRGITPDAAKELYADMKKELGDKFPALEKNMDSFRKWLGEVATDAYNEGLYSPELYKQMKENPNYVTFQVIDHIEDGISSKIYKSIGTFKDITNPADSSILKAVATIRTIERNKTIKGSVDFLIKHYPKEIEPATRVFTGKGQQFVESKKDGMELITFKRGGKNEGYYVDEYVAHSLNNDTIGRSNAIMKLVSPISFLNQNWFKPVYIGFNMGFQSFNFLRDFQRFWKSTPNLSVAKAMQRYIQAAPVAKARAFGAGKNTAANKVLQDLEESKVFSTTFTDVVFGASTEEKQIEIILRNSGIESFKPEIRATAWKKILTPFIKVLDTIQKVGNYIETLPKAAAVYHLTDGTGDVGRLTAEQRSFIRKNVGSPDFLRKGYATPVTNNLFLFSNAIKEGIRSDIQIATNPKTRSGYWWKTAKINLLPKILMFMASLGLMGKEVKDMMDGASEYDKTNYTVIPVGKDENDKTIYIRIPQDESGRFTGALFWKALGFFDGKEHGTVGQQLSEVFSLLGGQVPTISPAISTPKTILTYLQGKNPYDSFRGRNVISDELFKANNWDTDKAFLGYIFNQLGGGIFYNFYSNGTPPGQAGKLEEFVKLPIISNILGRFIKVSDYGITESLNKVKAEVQTEQARETLANRTLVDKYVEKGITADALQRTKLEKDLVREKFPDGPKSEADVTKAKALITKFRTGLVKGISGPEVDALIGAATNAEKIALLKEIRSRMSDAEFKELRNLIIREKIISVEAYAKFEHEN